MISLITKKSLTTIYIAPLLHCFSSEDNIEVILSNKNDMVFVSFPINSTNLVLLEEIKEYTEPTPSGLISLYINHKEINGDTYLVIMRLPPKYENVLTHFRAGEYSKITASAVNQIIYFYSRDKPLRSTIAGVLHRTTEYKEFIVNLLGLNGKYERKYINTENLELESKVKEKEFM